MQIDSTEIKPAKKKSEKRKRNDRVVIRLLPEERAIISQKAKGHGVSEAEFFRRLGLDKSLTSVFDKQALLEVTKLHADLNRLGGLIKLWLAERDTKLPVEGGVSVSDLHDLLRDIRQVAKSVEGEVQTLFGG